MAECGLAELAPVPDPHDFPRPQAASGLGLRLPRTLRGIKLWLPATTVVMIGARQHG